MMRRFGVLAAAVIVGACSRSDSIVGTAGGVLPPPTNLSYSLVPSGDAARPDGIVLTWDAPSDTRITNFVVYSRASSTAAWRRRAETTSPSFHDAGTPDLQYYVTSEDASAFESAPSNSVTVNPANALAAPSGLATITLNRAIRMSWSAAVRQANPTLFDYYRTYSTPYNLDTGVCDAARWALEGTTVSEDFIASGLPNGSPRCFSLTTVSRDGHESAFATPHVDTPRFDARNVVVYSVQSRPATSGFRFGAASSGVLGAITSGTDATADFFVDRHADGSLWLAMSRSGSRVALYGTTPVTDLTSIDIAPAGGYAGGAIEAVAGYLYVFELRDGTALHYGAVRITATSSAYVILDWAYQTDPGNPMLNRVPAGAVMRAAH
ncbi:MAG: hypothetical protein ABJD07_05760 [Gemmatimonadaceae bacterium]